MADVRSSEGYIPVTGGHVWYRVVGDADAIPLLCLHGGPGFPHDYLEPLAGLADERPVVFYDQLGCGKSDRPDDASLWRVERFVEELAQVRKALNLKRIHLFGHSWGTMLAVDCFFRDSAGITSLILASPYLSMPHWCEDIFPTLIAALPEDVQHVLARHVAAGTTDSVEFQAAFSEYNRRHLCRLDPLPEPLQRAVEGANWQIRYTLFGADEFHVSGELKNYDQTRRLYKVNVPSLLTCGHYDDATQGYTAWQYRMFPNAEMVAFESSAHMAHLEETERYLHVIRDFLHRVERI